MQHHEQALAAYVASVREAPEALAVVVIGSVARGTEREDSDVDVYLVVTDEAFDRAAAADRFAWLDREGEDYPGSYIDIKLACPVYLATAVERADDPTRSSFVGARVAYSRMPELPALLERIVSLPDDVWSERVRSFVAQAQLYGGYFLRQADERGDEFLRRHAATHLVLAAARAALAAAHELMPGPKYVSGLMDRLPLPEGYLAAWRAALENPDAATGAALVDATTRLLPDGMAGEEALSVFIRDNELAWLRGTVPPEFG